LIQLFVLFLAIDKIIKERDFLHMNIDSKHLEKNKQVCLQIAGELKRIMGYFDSIIPEKELLDKVPNTTGGITCRERLIRHRDYFQNLIEKIEQLS